MKKTLTVNLWGQVFNIDEDAFDKLQKYLSSLENKFSETPESKEIIGDVEARLAEIFKERLAVSRQVVTLEDVDFAIGIIGLPEDFDIADNGSKDNKDESKKTKKTRRLYRDPDDRILGGVGGGLAAYFGIDPTVVRLLLVITFFFSGPLIYLVLWLIVPEAKTTAQKLEMRGEPVNLSNIEKNIKDEFSKVKENLKSKNTKRKFRNATHQMGEVFASIIHVFFRAFTIILGLAFLILGLVFLFSIFVGVFIDGASNINITSLFDTFIENNLLTPTIIGLSLVIVIPIISLIITGIRFIFGIRHSFKFLRKTLGFSFLMGLLLLIFVVMSHSISNKTSNQTKENIILAPLNNKTLVIDLNDNIKNKSSNNDLDFNNYIFNCYQDSCNLYGKPQITIQKTEDSLASISIVKICRTNSKKEGNYFLKQIPSTVFVTDSVVSLSEYFPITQSNKFHFQKEKITVYVPLNSKVYIKNTDDEFENIDFAGNYSYSEIKGKTCIMTQNGLEPVYNQK